MERSDIVDEFDTLDTGDQRLNERGRSLLSTLFNGISLSLPTAAKGWAELKAIYRFFDNVQVTPKKILQPHYEATIERIKQQPFVSLIQDTTDIDQKHLESVEDLGFLNDTTRPGCSCHCMIACTPDRLCLGVIEARYICRSAEEIKKEKIDNNLRNIEDKESYRWIESYRKAVSVAKQVPNTRFACITDREGDIFEIFVEAKIVENIVHLVIRSWHNRTVQVTQDEKKLKTKLDKVISDAESIGEISFVIPSRNKKPSRKVRQRVKIATVSIMAPKHKQNLGLVSINVIHLEEIDPPPGEDPICWTILTTLPVSTLKEVEFVIKLYLSRWTIEVFFHVLKTGCKIEDHQFDTAARLQNCITLYMIIAWRALFVTFLGRNCPELCCKVIFEDDEWMSVYAVVTKKKPPPEPPKLGEFMILIATLGGYLGRKHDPQPGPRAMWTGLQKMAGCAEGWAAYKALG